MRRAAILTAISVGLLGLIATAATGHTKRFSSEVTIRPDFGPEGDAFKGRVISTREFCERGRKVVLYRDVGAPDPTRLGSDRTDSTGRWRVALSKFAGPGDYYAVATRKAVTRPGHRHVCRRATSPVYEYTPKPPTR